MAQLSQFLHTHPRTNASSAPRRRLGRVPVTCNVVRSYAVLHALSGRGGPAALEMRRAQALGGSSPSASAVATLRLTAPAPAPFSFPLTVWLAGWLADLPITGRSAPRALGARAARLPATGQRSRGRRLRARRRSRPLGGPWCRSRPPS